MARQYLIILDSINEIKSDMKDSIVLFPLFFGVNIHNLILNEFFQTVINNNCNQVVKSSEIFNLQ